MIHWIKSGCLILAVLCGCESVDGDEYVIPPAPDTVAELWECYKIFDPDRNQLTLTIDPDYSYGTVDFNGIVARTQYSVEGLSRRWDWGWQADNGFDYAVIVSGDGWGGYYNFRMSKDGATEPSDVFRCERR